MMEFRSKGKDVYVDKDARIVRPHLVDLGNHIAIDMCTYISTEAIIGDYVHIAPHVSIIGGADSKLIMGHFTNIGSGSKILCGSDNFNTGLINPLVPIEYRDVRFTTVTFEYHATVGVNCVIMPGITLAEGSVVGANSVVTKDTEPWGIYVGSPARKVGERDKKTILEHSKKMGYN